MKKNTLFKITFVCLYLVAFSIKAQNKQQKERKIFNQSLNIESSRSLDETGFIRCASDEYEVYLQEKYPQRFSNQEFENWLEPKLSKIKTELANESFRGGSMTIPIIFHVFTDGSGSENVSAALIQAQIDQLNIDYANLAGSSFNVAADTQIQFCAAQVNESGVQLDEVGINRITEYGQGPFSTSQFESTLKAATQWDPTQYFNVWVANITGGVLGYAQFPSNSGLNGLNTNGGAANTDGVVLLYSSVGSIANSNPYGGVYGAGRTLTHEAGHWLGLRHIWGDGGCGVDDYCNDTPLSGQANYGCPIGTDSCTSGNTAPDMIENYMDYTNDACMDTFTNNQSLRIATVMANSPRRMELLTSTVCQPAIVYDLDGRTEVESLNADPCTLTITPEIKLVNNGNNALTSANVSYDLDGGSSTTISWTGNLANYGDYELITLSEMSVESGDHTFNVSITSPNGSADMNTANDLDEEDFSFGPTFFGSTSIELELVTDDYGYETSWDFRDSSDNILYYGGDHPTLGGTEYNDNVTINQTFTIENDECYTFTMYDAYGDGICCNFGSGSYSLTDNSGTIIVTGGEFEEEELTQITTAEVLSTTSYDLDSFISLYPNPANNVLNIKMSNGDLPDSFVIYNTLGQVVSRKIIGSSSDLMINTAAYSNGMYFIKINKANSSTTLPFIKQ